MRERRQDITVFYAFCRVIDDIADCGDLTVDEKRRQLEQWRVALRMAAASEPDLAREVRGLMAKYSLAPEMLEEIIAGVEMDLDKWRYATFEDLRVYCYRVASAVGFVSIEIFGYRNPACKEYAIQLGLALQMTNIIRDVGKDLRNGRIYLPREDLARFDYSESDLREGQYDDRFVRLMQFEAERARGFFARRRRCFRAKIDNRWSRPKSCAPFYGALLRRMERDKFRVFEKDYHLNKLEKAGRIVAQFLKFS